ncbi:MAG: sigma-54 dependent transcriptional regulator [Deltaproteobacteria bacterium]|nr:sigma-54 dependent transcriptional regulator [Deltaproteobacteria bacterium]
MASKILLLEDERVVRLALRKGLEAGGHEVHEEESVAGAIAALQDRSVDLAVIDYRLPDGTAIDVLERIEKEGLSLPVVVLTAHGSIELAVETIQKGASQFLTKPVELSALRVLVDRLLESAQRQRRDEASSRTSRTTLDPFVGTSDAIRRVEEQARRVVEVGRPILILGETGTGKGVLARWFHEGGPRRGESFVDLNCAGFAAELLESELFGHEKGSFTGATVAKKGLFEVGNRGTVFLDELGDMDLRLQPRMLKVLEEKKQRRVGGVRDIPIDVQIIAATNQDLNELVEEKKFRSDLYFRINTLPIELPALRERAEDLPLLAEVFLQRFSQEFRSTARTLSPAALRALQAHHWPGNIRELRNVLDRALVLSTGEVIEPDVLFLPGGAGPGPRVGGGPGEGADLSKMSLREVERWHIEQVLAGVDGLVEDAAEILGLSRSALYQKIKKHEIVIPRS